MKLAFITPGTGNYYCGVCMRDNSLARSLMDAGHEVTMLPTYLPHFLDEEAVAEDQPIFFGGINVYLQHKFSLFRHTPAWLDRVFDCKWLLRKAAARSDMTEGKDLGEITLATFRGEDGPIAKEVRKVVDWFRENEKPDVVLLSTILLAGLGRVLRRELSVPVVGFLQGEDSFLDSLPDDYRPFALNGVDVVFAGGGENVAFYELAPVGPVLQILREEQVRHRPRCTRGCSRGRPVDSSGGRARFCQCTVQPREYVRHRPRRAGGSCRGSALVSVSS